MHKVDGNNHIALIVSEFICDQSSFFWCKCQPTVAPGKKKKKTEFLAKNPNLIQNLKFKKAKH